MKTLRADWNRYYDPKTGSYITADPIGLTGGINLFGYVGGNPVNLIDPSGLAVYRCCRDINVSPKIDMVANFFGVKHCFVRTDTKEAGMGPADNGPLPAFPLGVKTKINDHTGESWISDCVPQDCIDEDCVNRELQINRNTGRWMLWNNCNTEADRIIKKCKKKKSECCEGKW